MADTIITKVLITASEFEPFTNVGQLGRVVKNLSVALCERANGDAETPAESAAVPAGGDAAPAADYTAPSGDVTAPPGDVIAPSGDVTAPEEAPQHKFEVRVVIPRYSGIPKKYLEAAMPLCEFDVALGRRIYPCSVYVTVYCGVTVYFLSCGDYFDRSDVYSTVVDDVERYSCFCNAVLAMFPRINYYPDVIQCHDWQMSYISTLYKTSRSRRWSDICIKTLLVIHSMQYQGICSRYEMLDLLDLPTAFYNQSTVEFYGQANSLKGGLLFSDKLVTVSPSHAVEIQHAYYGESLDGIIRSRSADLEGVRHGIDHAAYNPAEDNRIFMKYGAGSAESGKLANKLWLQELLGFEQNADIPLVLVINSGLEHDKGIELIKGVFDEVMETGVQLVIVGKGKMELYDFLASKVAEYEDRVALVCYDNAIWDGGNWFEWDAGGRSQHEAGQFEKTRADSGNAGLSGIDECEKFSETMLMSACDILLRPSRIEPSGEKALIALRYGAVPIIRETGGLKDVVETYDEETGAGNGFTFFNYNAHEMLYILNRAVSMFKNDKKTWARLIRAGMNVKLTWEDSARDYMKIYLSLCGS